MICRFLNVVAAALLSPVAAFADESTFRAGAFVIDVTPETFPVESAGSMGPRVVDAAHDPLNVRCLVLDDGTTTLAFAVCDHCMIPRDIVDAARAIVEREAGIPAANILCSATHTHSGVTLAPTFQSNVETEYCEFLTTKIADGIIEAHRRLRPAKIGWAIGNNPNQVFNRRWHMRSGFSLADPFDNGTDKVRMNPPAGNSSLLKPAGPTDPEVPIISVVDSEGTPIALLANYSLHYVGGIPGGALSADYFGEFAVQIARLLNIPNDSDFVAIMSNGTSGDINNINFFDGVQSKPPFEQIRFVATDVAESAVRAMQRIEYRDDVTLTAVETEIELGVRKPTADEIARATRLLDQAGPGPYGDVRLIYANETLDLAEYPNTVKARLQALRIGELAIVTSPCETFVETGLAIKKLSPFRPTFTIELANGYNGYLPTAEQHAFGGYETWRAKSSYLAVDSEEKIRSTLLKLLDQLRTPNKTSEAAL
ncbi:MAG: hypothetical protein R3C19_02775 [Planctomycetaceae bacterium]